MKLYNYSVDIFLSKRVIRLQLTNYDSRAYLKLLKNLFFWKQNSLVIAMSKHIREIHVSKL